MWKDSIDPLVEVSRKADLSEKTCKWLGSETKKIIAQLQLHPGDKGLLKTLIELQARTHAELRILDELKIQLLSIMGS